MRLTLTGDGGFQRELDIVIRDEDDYPVSLSLSAETGVADNIGMSVQRVLATIDVDEGEDEQDGGEIDITSISRPDGVSVSDAEDLVEIFGTTLRMAGDIAPDDIIEMQLLVLRRFKSNHVRLSRCYFLLGFF